MLAPLPALRVVRVLRPAASLLMKVIGSNAATSATGHERRFRDVRGVTEIAKAVGLHPYLAALVRLYG